MDKMYVKNMDSALLKVIKANPKYEIEEFYGAFEVADRTKLVSEELPFAFKIGKGKEVLMTVDEYFNTKVGNLVYAQIRTAPVVEGEDKNTFTYPDNAELDLLIKMFTLDKVKSEVEFNEAQKLEAVNIEEIIKEEDLK